MLPKDKGIAKKYSSCEYILTPTSKLEYDNK